MSRMKKVVRPGEGQGSQESLLPGLVGSLTIPEALGMGGT
jgi:hypothetical protein